MKMLMEVETEIKTKSLHPALVALARKFPELAYINFQTKGYGFVYDIRRNKNSRMPIAKIIHHLGGKHSVVVGDKVVRAKLNSITLCLQFIRKHILGVV